MPVFFKGIKPSKLRDDVFRLESLNTMRKAGTAVRRDYKKTTATWKGSKPNFDQLVSLAGGGPTLVIEVNGGHGADKWFWLDRGTKVRYAVMSRNFRAKTSVGKLSSGSGRGGLIFVNKKRPMPGIKARGWTVLIVRMWTPRFKRLMEGAMGRAAKKSGHYIGGI